MPSKIDPARLGRCYELAYDFVQSNPSWTLVHGIAMWQTDDGHPIGNHAWAELSGAVWEPYSDKIIPKKKWYEHAFDNDPPERYTAKEALWLFRRFHSKDWTWEMREALKRS